MKAPNLPSLTLSLPALQTGHRRGSRPEPSSGKKCRPSSVSSAASTWLMVSSLVPSTAAEKSRQKSRSISFQSGGRTDWKEMLVLEIGGERVFDVALEKAGQKRGDEPPTVFWQETALLNPDVRTIL